MAVFWVTAVALVHFLAWELPHTIGAAKKNKKQKNLGEEEKGSSGSYWVWLLAGEGMKMF